MFKSLLKLQFRQIFNPSSSAERKKKRSDAGKLILRIAIIVLYLFVGVVFAAMAGAFLFSIVLVCDSWFYFAMTFLIAFLFCIIGSVFSTYIQLFSGRDNAFLLSMPIPPSYIIASRTISLVIMNFAFEAVVVIPSFIIFSLMNGFSFLSGLLFVLIAIVLPFLSFSVSAVIGFVISFIISRFKNKSIVKALFGIAFMCAYFVIYFKFVGNMSGAEQYDFTRLQASLYEAMPWLYYLGAAVAYSRVLYFLAILLIGITVFVAIMYFVVKLFMKLATSSTKSKRIAYKERAMSVRAPIKAFYVKEIKRFFSSSAYIMNAGFGAILMILAPILALINKSKINALFFEASNEMYMPDLMPMMSAIVFILIIFVQSMTPISSSSVSLEGKNVWIAQSMPVHMSTPLFSKVLAHLTIIGIPAVFALVLLNIAYPSGVLLTVFNIVACLSSILLFAIMGVAVNVRFPMLVWMAESVPVKRGLSTTLCTLGGMALSIIFGILGFVISLLGKYALAFYYIAVTVAMLVVSYILFRYIKNGGAQRFGGLSAND